MYPRFYKCSKNKSFFLFGPRGTGKTTWLKAQFSSVPRLDLLRASTLNPLLADPSRLEGMVGKDPDWIVIDEVQRAPALLDEVHRLIEDKKWKFVLTGSSARKLRRGAANLLAGRALHREFFPLTLWEIGSEFHLSHALRFGMLPSVWNEEDPQEFLSAYVYTYLKEEVQAEGLTRSIPNFSRFLEVMSFSQAAPINKTSIARDVGVDAKVIASYIEILEDLLIAVQLPVFKRKAKRRMASQPKFFYFDPGVARILRPKGPIDNESDMDGPALETLFLHHYRALGAFSLWEENLFYWRSADKREVDFISYGPAGIFAFEIKRSAVVRDDDLKGLRAFNKDYPESKLFLFYGGSQKQRLDGVEIYPFEDGLRSLPDILGYSVNRVG